MPEKTRALQAKEKGFFVTPRRRRRRDAKKRRKIRFNGKIVCRCESVTEGEIVDSIVRPLGAVDPDGVKRRTRAGMGRCQSDFCFSRVAEILSEKLGIPAEKLRFNAQRKSGSRARKAYEKRRRGQILTRKNTEKFFCACQSQLAANF